jgi:hypothetical protein
MACCKGLSKQLILSLGDCSGFKGVVMGKTVSADQASQGKPSNDSERQYARLTGSRQTIFRRHFLLEDCDSRFPSRSNPDELDLNSQELLDEMDVIPAIWWELVELRAIRDIGLPSGKSGVLHLDAGEAIQVGY